jgi:hypothetical protein
MARLEHDCALLCDRYPDLVFSSSVGAHRLELAGTLRLIEEETGQPTDLRLRFVFPDDYPLHEPTLYEEGGRFPRIADRHINQADGSCCLWLEPLSRWNASDRNALLVLLERVSVFCEDQLTYEVIGRFLHGEWAHGDAGYAEHLFERLGSDNRLMDALAARTDPCELPDRNATCLCRSGKKFKKCHMPEIEPALRQLGAKHFRAAVDAWRRGDRGRAGTLRSSEVPFPSPAVTTTGPR